jgi:hypothetical protein
MEIIVFVGCSEWMTEYERVPYLEKRFSLNGLQVTKQKEYVESIVYIYTFNVAGYVLVLGMTWIVVNKNAPPVELDDDQLASLIGSLSKSKHKLQEEPPTNEVSQLIVQLQVYFTNPDQPGYATYTTINRYLTDIITTVINNNRSDKFQFEEPYTFKELAVLWTAYNVIGEILDWLSAKLRAQTDQNTTTVLRNMIAFGIDLLGIIISFRMREFTETDIYGRILPDRKKWGFLLKDRDKQVFSQLMHVFMDLGSITYLAASRLSGIQSLTQLPAMLDTMINLKFISQAYSGLVSYSESKVSPGWIAWLVQELGFLHENDHLPEKIQEISPFTWGIVGDLITVLTMGSIFYSGVVDG